MSRRKFETDEERMNAVREYRKQYYAANAEVLKERSRLWRANRKRERAAAAAANTPDTPTLA